MINLYNLDCLEGIKKIPAVSVDLICTDPPYYCGATSNGIKATFSDFQMLFSNVEAVLAGMFHTVAKNFEGRRAHLH